MSEEIIQDNTINEEEQKNLVLQKYMKKTSFKKRLSYIIVLGVSLLLVALVLVLTFVKVSVRPYFLSNQNPAIFEIYTDGTQKAAFDDNDTPYATVYNEYNKAFSMSIMTAMFTGQTGSYVIDETGERFDTSKLPSLVGSDYVNVRFNDTQVLLKSDKNPFESQINTQAKELTFKNFYFAFENERGYNDVTFVIPVYGNYTPSGTIDNTIPTIVKITVKANLYDFSQELKNVIK